MKFEFEKVYFFYTPCIICSDNAKLNTKLNATLYTCPFEIGICDFMQSIFLVTVVSIACFRFAKICTLILKIDQPM